MIATYFKLLKERIQKIVPEIATIELYANQYNRTNEERPIITPAVYIEFNNISWRDTGINTQEGILTLNVHFVVPHLLSTSDADFNTYHLQVLKLFQKIHLALQGYQLFDNYNFAHSTKLSRLSTLYETNSDGLQIWINSYQCTIIDSSSTDNSDQLSNIQNLTIYGNL